MVGSVINVSMRNPHSPLRYRQLWLEAFHRQRHIKIWSDFVGMIGSAEVSKDDPDIITGDLYKFLDLDQIRDWFNTQTNRQAVDTDLKSIKVPEHLKPHFVYVPYLLDTKAHKLFFVTKDGDDSLSTALTEKFLKAALNTSESIDKFGKIGIVIEPESAQLERIFAMKKINSLTIEFSNPPNVGDDLDDATKAAMEQLEMQRIEVQNIKRSTLILQGHSDHGLDPDGTTRALAEIAQSNGKVTAKGKELGSRKSVTISTSRRPMEANISYNPDIESRESAFNNLVIRLRLKLRRGSNGAADR